MRRVHSTESKSQTDSWMDDRAVSEVIGFVIVFGLIIGSVGILYVAGFGAMEDFQEGEQLRNAERAFDALAENFNDVAKYDGIDRRAGEISLRSGTLSLEPDDGATINLSNSSGNIDEWDDEPLGVMVYEHGDSTVGYEGGGVFHGVTDGDGSVAVRDPSVACDGGVVSLIKIENDQPTVESAGTRELRITETDVDVYTDDPSIDFDFETSEYEMAWDELADEDCSDPSVVRITTVEIEY